MSRRPIFFDLETTGRDVESDRIVEIAAFDPTLNRTYQRLVNPGCHIPEVVTGIHGITDEMVKNEPSFAVAGKEFIEFCHGEVMFVAHNGEAFDLPFLQSEFRRHRLSLLPSWALVDSLKWARKYRKDLPRHALQYLREHFGIPENHAHRALDDTIILHQVFSLMVDDLTCEEIMDRIGGIRALAPQGGSSPGNIGKESCVLELF